MRDLILDFKRGGASVPEVVHGIVRIWGTEVRPNGPSVVVTTETTLKLSDGKATLANAQTSGTGPLYEWAYIIQVEPFCGRNFRFYVAIPDGTTPINLVDLPKLNPQTGEGIYVDFTEWEALYADLPERVNALEQYAPSVKPATSNGYKSVGVPCSLGQGVSTTTGQGYARLIQRMPTTATRARVRIRNINPRFETADSDPMTLTNISIGARATGASNATSWVTVAATGSTGSGGYVSPWITVPAGMLGSDVFVGYGWECAGTVQRTLSSAYTGSTAADALTGVGTRGAMAPAFVTLEVEVPSTTPVLAVFGDSIPSGVGTTAPIYYSWPDLYAAPKGIVATHWTHSGDAVSEWQDPLSPKWSLYGTEIAAADAVLYAMNSNDIFKAAPPTLAQLKAQTIKAVEIMRRMISPNVYGVTVTPRDGVTGPKEIMRREYNAWMPESGLFRDVFDIIPAVSPDDETLYPASTTDGIHFNATASQDIADTIDRPIVTSSI